MSDDEVPTGTFGDYAPSNPNASEHPSNYEICDRSGFRVPAGGLIKTWDGLMVRPRDWEPRHDQDFLRGRPESPNPPRSPESPDEFLSSNEVSTDEL